MARVKRRTLMANPHRKVEVYYEQADARATNAGSGTLVPWGKRPNLVIPQNEPFLVLASKRKGGRLADAAMKVLTADGRIAWINFLYVGELVIVYKNK